MVIGKYFYDKILDGVNKGGGVKQGPTTCRAKRYVRMFKALVTVEAGLERACTRKDLHMCSVHVPFQSLKCIKLINLVIIWRLELSLCMYFSILIKHETFVLFYQ